MSFPSADVMDVDVGIGHLLSLIHILLQRTGGRLADDGGESNAAALGNDDLSLIHIFAAKIHNFFRAQRRLDRLVIKIPGASQSSVYKNRFQQEAESVAPRNVRNVRTRIPIAPPMTAMAMLPMAAPRMALSLIHI